MNKNNSGRLLDIGLATVFLCFFLVLYGALPFIGIPTLGQALWSSSFAQSFANNGFFTVYASNIGAPSAAAMAFGLAGAWIQSLFIRMGFFPADAYSLMCAFWIVIAYIAAYKLALKFCMDRALAIIAAAAWISLPVCWGHTAFSMLAFGILLLPLYFLSAINLHACASSSLPEYSSRVLIHILCCIVSVFMDGYTFMMFAIGCFSLAVARFCFNKELRRLLLVKCFPVHFASFACAYVLYSYYIGASNTDGIYNDYFSITGLNLFNLLVPQQGVSWAFEAVRLGVSGAGDIRMAAFSAPILLLAMYMALKMRGTVDDLGRSVLCVSALALFLSFGPHLQFPQLSQLDFSNISVSLTAFSFEKFYLIPTGSELLYKYLPGFNSMRVTFRWVALAIFMWWLFVVINLRPKATVNRRIALFLLLSVAVCTPNLLSWANYSINQRDLFSEVESELVTPLNALIEKNEIVAFVPWTNDMVVPYVASRGGYVTLNIAGDKNILRAKSAWPANFTALGHVLLKAITAADAPKVVSILASGEANVVVIPNIIRLWGVNELPCAAINMKNDGLVKAKPRGEGFICPSQMLTYDPAVVTALRSDNRVSVVEREYFTLVRLHPD
jgi:hypothetical protein